jgi:hypothetical protein
VALLRRALPASIALAFLILALSDGTADATVVTEAEAKAALLYNFVPFVEWPPSVRTSGAPTVIGIVGDAAVLAALRRRNGELVRGRPLAVKALAEPDDATACHVIYLPGTTREREAAAILRRVADAPVLTVSDADDFTRRGGIVSVYFEESHLRFDVSVPNANRAHLKISSKVLGLARPARSDGNTQ